MHHPILIYLVLFESKFCIRILWEYFIFLFVNLWEKKSKCEIMLEDSQVWGINWGVVQEWGIFEYYKGCLKPKIQEGWLES